MSKSNGSSNGNSEIAIVLVRCYKHNCRKNKLVFRCTIATFTKACLGYGVGLSYKLQHQEL